jgi:hypothetical protein
LPVNTLMNRTLTYASLHTKDAFRSQTRISNCWSCTLTRSHSQWSQSLVLRLASPLRSRPNSPPVRLLSNQRARKQIVLGYRKGYPSLSKGYPLLKGESPPPLPRPIGVKPKEEHQRRKIQVAMEEARLKSRKYRKSKPLKDAEEKAEKRKLSMVIKMWA